jgi:hypothetical protein
MKIKRQYAIFVIALIIALIAIIAVVIVTRDDDNGNSNGSTGEENPDDGGAPSEGAGSVVTVIVVDDFTSQLGRLTDQIDDPENRFEEAANMIREMGAVPKQGEYDYTDRIAAIYEGLNAEFGERVTGLLAERIEGDPSEENCTLNTEGTGFYAAGGSGFYAAGGSGLEPFAHGYRVMALLEDFDSRYGMNVNIQFEQVDTEGFRMDTLADKLVQKIIEVRGNYPDGPIVVNMSFGLIPCEGVASLAIYEKLMLQYDPDLAEDAAWLREIFRAMVGTGIMTQTPLGDPTFNETFCEAYPEAQEIGMCDQEPDAPIIFVSASGNGAYNTPTGQPIGDPFPYYPAAWGEVIAISGNEDTVDFITEPPEAVWSNDGTILMPGRWEWINEELGIQRWEIGTSFAAPRYSYMIALYLAEATENVGCPTGDIPAPVAPHGWATNPPANPNISPC